MANTPVASAPNTSTLSGAQLRLAAFIVGFSFILSGLLGVIRYSIIGSTFSVGLELDAFYTAFRLPELLFTLVAGGALGSAFIPIYSALIGGQESMRASALANAVLSGVGLAGSILALIAVVFAPVIVGSILSPGAEEAKQRLTVDLMRIMLLTVPIFGVSGVMMGLLNANGRFLAPALAPSLNNLGMIGAALFLTPSFGIYGLAYGAVIGALLHLVIQLPTALRLSPRPRPTLQLNAEGASRVLRLMIPRIIGGGVVQLNFVVNAALASSMVSGSLSALTIAFSLMYTILGTLGQSVGTAVFPTLAILGSKEDKTGFRNMLGQAMRTVLLTTIPAGVGMMLLAAPLIETIFERGEWTPTATAFTAYALGFFAIGLPAFAVQEILTRAFFALKDTLTPVFVAVGGVILNVGLSLILINVISPNDKPFAGLALANVLATAIENVALWLLLRRRAQHMNDAGVFGMAGRTLIAAGVMGAVVYGVVQVGRGYGLPGYILLIGGAVIGVVVFEAAALALRIPEARTVPGALLARLRRR